MNINDYKNKVIDLFKSGKATDEQWGEMANAVLEASESQNINVNNQNKMTFMIDKQIENCECPECLECVDIDELETFGGVCEACNEKL